MPPRLDRDLLLDGQRVGVDGAATNLVRLSTAWAARGDEAEDSRKHDVPIHRDQLSDGDGLRLHPTRRADDFYRVSADGEKVGKPVADVAIRCAHGGRVARKSPPQRVLDGLKMAPRRDSNSQTMARSPGHALTPSNLRVPPHRIALRGILSPHRG